jgi:hypothetical protein
MQMLPFFPFSTVNIGSYFYINISKNHATYSKRKYAKGNVGCDYVPFCAISFVDVKVRMCFEKSSAAIPKGTTEARQYFKE